MIKINIAQSILVASLLCVSIEAKDMQTGEIQHLSSSPISKPVSYLKKQPSVAPSNTVKKKKVSVPTYKEGRVIVKYKSGLSSSNINTMASSMGLEVVKTYSKLSKKNPISVIESSKSTEEMIKILEADPRVESVSPDYIRQLDSNNNSLDATPNDPDFDELWGMNNTGQTGGTDDADIDAVEAWDVSKGSADVVTAVFDTGIDYRHSDLKENLWVNQGEIPGDGIDNDGNGYIDDIYGYDVAADDDGNNDGDPLDIHGHGTHVSGTIGAKGNDGYGITGINWDASIMTLKIFPPSLGAWDSDILEAIEYVLIMKDRGVNIVAINASYGGGGGSQDDAMNAAIQGLGDAGIVFCAAAGNDGTDNDSDAHFPSSYDADNIISVASTDHNDDLSGFSNYGVSSVDLAAPGSAIYSTMKGEYKNDYEPKEGDPYFVDVDDSESWYVFSDDDTYWDLSTANTHSAPYSLADSPSGEYLDNQLKGFYPQTPIDLTVMADENLAFGFWAKLDIEEGWDYLHVFFSADGGENWSLMKSWDGEDQPMQAYSVEIPNEFQTNNFLYAFALETDGSVTYNGAYVDDIGIGIGSSSYEEGGYASWSGTSMATPHVTGAVALLANVYGSDSAVARKARILDSIDTLPSLSSKVLTEGRLNLNSAIRSGIAEICPEGEHHIQGTLICVLGTAVPPPELLDNPCGEDMRMTQGTEVCLPVTEVEPSGIYLPSPNCPAGERTVQGTEDCEVVPG